MDGNDPSGREGGEDAHAAGLALPGERGWEVAKHDVLYSGKSLKRIADEQGIAETTLRNRIKAFGWVRIVPTRRLKPGPKLKRPEPLPLIGTNAEALRRERIVARLFRVLDRKMTMLEERMSDSYAEGAPAPSAADIEYETREMNAIMGLYAKLVALDEAEHRSGKGGEAEAARSSEDADRLRRDLALRLERLNRAGDS